jgi:hypothetical protein
MLQWDGGTTWSTITGGKTTLRFAHLVSFAGHLIGAGIDFTEAGSRTIRISDAQDQTTWTPAISNSADATVLDDSVSGITGFAMLEQNTIGVFTRAGCYGLSPTGNIPPFTRSYLGMHVACDASDATAVPNANAVQSVTPFIGTTPYGAAYVSFENVYLGLGQAVGTPVAKAILLGNQPCSARVLWHNQWRVVVVPAFFYDRGYFVLNAPGGAWGRMDQPGASPSPYNDQTVILYGVPNSDVQSPCWKHVITNNGDVYVERTFPRTFGTPDTRLAFVDTKDFALPVGRYVNRMRVDWEAVQGSPALQVEVLTREELDPQTEFVDGPPPQPTPTTGYYYDLSGAFAAMPDTHRATLGVGQAEVPLHARGKWIRFRFSHTGGQVRIRGFAFRTDNASDRADSPDAAPPMFPGEWDAAAWDISSWAGPDGWE